MQTELPQLSTIRQVNMDEKAKTSCGTQRMLDAVGECTFRSYRSITDSIRTRHIAIDASEHHVRTQVMLDAVWECYRCLGVLWFHLIPMVAIKGQLSGPCQF